MEDRAYRRQTEPRCMEETKEKEIKINPELGFRCECVETDDETQINWRTFRGC
jgi:hypothetical protein